MIQAIAVVAVILVAALLVYAATRPDEFRVVREAAIQAPPERIYAHLVDLHRWIDWSPWEKKDPAMKRTHSGAANGAGAAYAWEGNKEVGSGRMEITAVVPGSKVVIALHFLKPFEARNTVEFTLAAQGGATKVTWLMHGPANFITKLMGVFMNMDRMIGRDFEAGLANLKAVAEKPAS